MNASKVFLSQNPSMEEGMQMLGPAGPGRRRMATWASNGIQVISPRATAAILNVIERVVQKD